MAADRPRCVVDAGVIIAFLNREEGRFQRSKELFDEAEDGAMELWAPAVLLAEVSRWSVDADLADDGSVADLDAFLESPWLQIVDVDRRMARMARAIVRQTTVRTGIDALYVATAVIAQAPFIMSWDQRILDVRYDDVAGTEPPGSRSPRLPLKADE